MRAETLIRQAIGIRPLTATELAKGLDITPNYANTILRNLYESGEAARKNAGGNRYRYSLSPLSKATPCVPEPSRPGERPYHMEHA